MSSPSTSSISLPLADALRSFEIFDGISEQQLQWFVSHASDETFETGAQVVHEGDEADAMTLIIEGELRFQSSQPGTPFFLARSGQVTGLLPFSRLKRYTGNVYAIQPLRVARLHRKYFDEMLRQIPLLAPRLVAIMSDRIRDNTRIVEQREKLAALGKLAAGLAHELNNPASAAQRSAYELRRSVELLRDANQSLAEHGFNAAEYRCLIDVERKLMESAAATQPLEALESSDRADALSEWFKSFNTNRSWELAPIFVDAGIDRAYLTEITSCFVPAALDAIIYRLAATLSIERLIAGVEFSTQRMTDLIRSVKEYSFVDQAPQQDVDIHRGLENTLAVLAHRLRGVAVVRQYDESLPPVPAWGSELNQVWTNLIDNAIDAMSAQGTLYLRTSQEAGFALIEILDNGSGISPEIRDRVFDPFFTTKDVGAGRGLGLDTAFRTIQKHRGDIRFTSRPGATCFQVRLPLQLPDVF